MLFSLLALSGLLPALLQIACFGLPDSAGPVCQSRRAPIRRSCRCLGLPEVIPVRRGSPTERPLRRLPCLRFLHVRGLLFKLPVTIPGVDNGHPRAVESDQHHAVHGTHAFVCCTAIPLIAFHSRRPTMIDNKDLWDFTNQLNEHPTFSYCPLGRGSFHFPGLFHRLRPDFANHYKAKCFDWKRLTGAKVVRIDEYPARDYIDKVVRTDSGNFLDHNVRVNGVVSSYQMIGGNFSRRLGDLPSNQPISKAG